MMRFTDFRKIRFNQPIGVTRRRIAAEMRNARDNRNYCHDRQEYDQENDHDRRRSWSGCSRQRPATATLKPIHAFKLQLNETITMYAQFDSRLSTGACNVQRATLTQLGQNVLLIATVVCCRRPPRGALRLGGVHCREAPVNVEHALQTSAGGEIAGASELVAPLRGLSVV